ncbi:MAG: SMC-Scp complex subunit ScpB [Nanoarchaeota archaeon]|nr:SMC-Scp complex subunit ScpB [Nanoarchaeota archaeon]
MQEIKNKIEAILFITGKFLDVTEIAKLTGVGSIGVVRDALQELEQKYLTSKNALTIFKDKGRYKLNIKKKYSHLTTQLLTNSELDKGTQETLAIIAYKQPVLQCNVIKIRGNKAYEQIKVLREEDFISSERYGRTRLLKLNQKFYDYFDVIEDHLESKFKEIETKVGNSEEVQKKLKENKKEGDNIISDLPKGSISFD